jgi:hypothetical protein
MVYNAAKKFTDPFANALAGGDLGQAATDLFNAPKNAAGEFLGGAQEFVGGPMGLAKDRTLKEAWSDPAASLTALAPLAKGAGGAIAKAIPRPVGLVEKSLRFSPDTDPKLQARVAETIYNEGAVTTRASYNEFVKKIEDRAKEVWELIGPVAKQEVMPDIAKAQEAARTWAGTSTDMGKNIKKIDGYFERFLEDHPTLTVEEAQKIKVNLNKDLTNYYKAVAKGDKVKVDPTIEAKKELMYVLRDVVNEAAPGTGEINTNISDLMTAKPFLKHAMNQAAKRPLLDAPTYHAGVLGGMAGTLLGDYSTGGGMGMAAMGASRLLTDQRVQSGTARAMRSISRIPERLRSMLPEKEAASIVAELEPEMQKLLPAPERGFEMRDPGDVYSPYSAQSAYSPELAQRVNQLALPGEQRLGLPMPERGFEMRNPAEVYSPYSSEFAANIPTTKALPPGAPKEIFREPTTFDRLFQIAQSPEGMRLLKEKLGREEKYTKLLEELSGATEYNLLDYMPNTDMNQVRSWNAAQPGVPMKQVQQYQILPGGKVMDVPASSGAKVYRINKPTMASRFPAERCLPTSKGPRPRSLPTLIRLAVPPTPIRLS